MKTVASDAEAFKNCARNEIERCERGEITC